MTALGWRKRGGGTQMNKQQEQSPQRSEDMNNEQVEPVAFITPLMESQMFDDWCPYKGNPDPRVVWAAAIEAVNGLLLGATPQQRKPLTDREILDFWLARFNVEGSPINNFARAIEAAHGITGDQ